VTNEAILEYIQVPNHFPASQLEMQQRKNTHHANDRAGYDILDKLWIELLLLQLKVMSLQKQLPKELKPPTNSIWVQNHNNLIFRFCEDICHRTECDRQRCFDNLA